MAWSWQMPPATYIWYVLVITHLVDSKFGCRGHQFSVKGCVDRDRGPVSVNEGDALVRQFRWCHEAEKSRLSRGKQGKLTSNPIAYFFSPNLPVSSQACLVGLLGMAPDLGSTIKWLRFLWDSRLGSYVESDSGAEIDIIPGVLRQSAGAWISDNDRQTARLQVQNVQILVSCLLATT